MTRRLVLVCALLLVLCLPASGGNVVVVKHAGGGGGGGCTNTSVTFWDRCESATQGAGDYSAGGTTANLTGGGIAFDTTQVKMGTNSLKVPGTTSNWAEYVVAADDIVNNTTGRIGFWFRYKTQTWPISGQRLFTIYGSADDQIRVSALSTTGYLRATYRGDAGGSGGNTNIDTTGLVISADTWHFVELVWDESPSNGSEVLKLYVDNTLVAGNASQDLAAWNAGVTSATFLYFGDYIGGGNHWAGETYYDQIIISSDPNKDVYACKDTRSYPP